MSSEGNQKNKKSNNRPEGAGKAGGAAGGAGDAGANVVKPSVVESYMPSVVEPYMPRTIRNTANVRRRALAAATAKPPSTNTTRKNWRGTWGGKIHTLANIKPDKVFISLSLTSPPLDPENNSDMLSWTDSGSKEYLGVTRGSFEKVPVLIQDTDATKHPKFFAEYLKTDESYERIELPRPATYPGIIDPKVENILSKTISIKSSHIKKTSAKVAMTHDYNNMIISYDADVYVDTREPSTDPKVSTRKPRPFVFYLNISELPSKRMGYILFLNHRDGL